MTRTSAPAPAPAEPEMAQRPAPQANLGDVRALQRAIGNRATGRVLRALAERRLQRYAVVPAANYAILSGQPEFEAQVVAPPAINPPAAAAPAQLRVSDDGDMAIEDTTLAARQPKVFYARTAVVTTANARLRAVQSIYELFSARANALRVTLPGQAPKDLDRVLPRVWHGTANPNQGGLTLGVGQDCIEVARAVMQHAEEERQPRTGNDLPDADFAEYRVARYMATWVREQIANDQTSLSWMWYWLGSADRAARAEFANGLRMDLATMNAIATDYANLLVHNAALADTIAQQLGVNRYALPNVGEAYETHRIGTGQPSQTRQVVPTHLTRDFWAQHIGGVVAASGNDRVTLENYARSHEVSGLQSNAPHYYFQMYGSGAGQSWHEAWTTGAVAHGLPPVGRPEAADRALTVVVRSG